MELILTGQATKAQIGAFMTALRAKGESVAEIVAAAEVVRQHGSKLSINNHVVSVDRDEINIEDETILDTSGTGGDGTNTFNVSTATAFVVAGAGIRVAKHGHRAVSSRCGSADVIAALGIRLDLNHSSMEACVQELGIGFLYAPLYNSAMRYVAAPRQEVGLRTIFNLVAPLTNPAGATAQVLGVYDRDLTFKMARVLARLGTRDAFVVFGEGTYDEISICGPTKVARLHAGQIETLELEPEQFGFRRALPEEIRGGNAAQNARLIRAILDGETGARRDMVLLNAAAACVAAGLDSDLKSGIERSAAAIDSGAARSKLEAVVAFTQGSGRFLFREM